MLRKITLAASLMAGLAAAPAFAGNAAAGLADLSTYNVVTFHDLTSNSHIGGRILVGEDLAGTGTIEVGQSGSYTPNAAIPTAVVLGNSEGTLKLDRGVTAAIGGYAKAIQGNSQIGSANILVGGYFDNGGNSLNLGSGDYVGVGGKLTSALSLNGTAKVDVGTSWTNAPSSPPAGVTQNKGAGFNSASIATYTNVFTTVKDDLQALSTSLASLTVPGANPSTTSISSGVLNLNAVLGSNALSLFNFTASYFNTAGDIAYNFAAAGSGPVIVNVTLDTAFNYHGNFNGGSDALGQKVIWNFIGTADVNLTGSQFYGTILAPGSKVSLTNNNVNGSIVADSLVQNGEIHLVPFTGTIPLAPVPEASTWAMMIFGFGLVGAVRRRQARVRFA